MARRGIVFWLVGIVWVAAFGGGVQAAEFHVTTAAELQDALNAAATNGEDDTIYLAAGTYQGNFVYRPRDGRTLTVRGEEGTTAQDVVLDGAGAGSVLELGGLGGSPQGGSVILEGLTLQNGNVPRGPGGGIKVELLGKSLKLVLRDVIVQHNLAGYRGGGISLRTYKDASLSVEIWNSIIRYNRSPGYEDGRQGRGGGIHAHCKDGNSAIDLLIVNSLIHGNQANWTGGGIGIGASEVGDGNTVRAVLINTTITGNVSDVNDRGSFPGGGIRVYGYRGNGARATLELYNCIVWGNTSVGGEKGQDLYIGERDPGDAEVRAYHCDLGDVFVDSSRGSPVYEAVQAISVDPLFVDPAGGDFRLGEDSPCINAGTIEVPEPPGLPGLDLAGSPRICGLAPDFGAYEWCPGG